MSSPNYAVLSAAGHTLILDLVGPRSPRVLHWGSDVGALTESDIDELRIAASLGQGHSSFDEAQPATITYDPADGFYGIPTISGPNLIERCPC